MGAYGGKLWKGWCDVDPNEVVFTFGGSYVCANFGENRSRNATVTVRTDEMTDTNRFYNHSMLYAIAMGQTTTYYDFFTPLMMSHMSIKQTCLRNIVFSCFHIVSLD